MVTLKPIKLLPARERVASALRKAIISKQIGEGEVITLEATAQQLGVSVTPVREAFQILARDGLIDLKQNKGATVLGLNETTIREHYEIRAALESAACVLCCQRKAVSFCYKKTAWKWQMRHWRKKIPAVILTITSPSTMRSGQQQEMKS